CGDRGQPPPSALCPSQPTVYAHVLQRRDDPAAFPDGTAPLDVQAVVEYWILYGYDRWERETPLGLLRQQHDGDWEGVLVALASGHGPVWAGFSSHCGGQARLWENVHVRDTTHLLAYVAEGSHANYPNRASASPDWLGCARSKHSGPVLSL